jgi:hypothetical protein
VTARPHMRHTGRPPRGERIACRMFSIKGTMGGRSTASAPGVPRL